MVRLHVSWSWFWLVLLTPAIAYAHCDIPCGIYSPWIATLAAKTVLTMVQKIKGLKIPRDGASDGEVTAYHSTIMRMTHVKEEHAEVCKRELQILWSDYFKPEHLTAFPKLHDTFWTALKLCSKNKQHVDESAAQSLQESVVGIAGMFEQAEEAKKVATAT